MLSMGKLDHLSPKHAVARLEAGGKSYEEMLDLVVEHARTLCHNNADNLVPAMTRDEETQRKYVDLVLRLDMKNYKSAVDFVARHTYMFLRRPKSVVSVGHRSPLTTTIHASWAEQEQDFMNRMTEHLEPLTLGPDGWTHDGIRKAIADVDASLRADISTPVVGEEAAGEEPFDPRLVSKHVWEHLRTSVCFGGTGPSLVDVMLLLGGDIVLDRLKNVKATPQDKMEPNKREKTISTLGKAAIRGQGKENIGAR